MITSISFFERLLHRLHLLPTPIVDAFGGILFGRALTIAVRRGVFEELANRAASASELATKTKLSSKGTELLLESFVSTGYVSTRNGSYFLTSEARKWLVQDSPYYLGNLIRYFETLYDRWEHLEYSLEHGKPPHPYYDKFTDEDWRVYVHGMADLARLMMNVVMSKISLPGSAGRLLDLGGSHGLWAVECCRRYPSLKATVVDFEKALKHTSIIIAQEGMKGRVQLLPGDIACMDFPPLQDCVLLFNVVHGFNDVENQRLIRRVLDALRPDGKLYILDQFRGERRRSGLSRLMPLMVGLNLLNEIGGNTYSLEQVRGWCSDAARFKQFRLRLPGVSLIEVVR